MTDKRSGKMAGEVAGEVAEMRLDDLLELIPVGLYHYRLLAICGMSFMSDAMVIVTRVSCYAAACCNGVHTT